MYIWKPPFPTLHLPANWNAKLIAGAQAAIFDVEVKAH